MWILESSSELFQGRRMWLKPGKSYLFGRVKKDGVRFAIDNKTISRKHFIIRVHDVNIEDVGDVHNRSRITIEDQKSKAGTEVNGNKLNGVERDLEDELNYIRPGSLPQVLVIRWCPYVLTYNLLRKEIKAGVLNTKQERIKDLDIKAVSDYIVGQTTHLVVNKRNTPKSLQALIDGKPLVADSYLDALEYAATPSDLNDEENLSPLEQDFDAAWPNPYDHLPPPGREPTSRPAEAYKPNTERKNVFESFTFVFLDQTQYDNLLPPISTGNGKALLQKIAVNETSEEEVITMMKEIAGNMHFGEVQKEADKGGVILVRYKGDVGAEEWTNMFINKISLRLDQRAIDQGEFLDAILANDAMLLRQPIPFESNHGEPPPPSSAPSLLPIKQSSSIAMAATTNHTVPDIPSSSASVPKTSSSIPQSSIKNGVLSRDVSDTSLMDESRDERSAQEDSPDPPARRARFMMPKMSRVFDFDDDFDPDAVVPYEDTEEQSNVHVRDHRETTPLQASKQVDEIKQEPISSRKRTRAEAGEGSAGFDDHMDELLPAAAAMKRRKLKQEPQNDATATALPTKAIPALRKRPKPEKEIDVREAARLHREAEERMMKDQEQFEDEFRLEPGEKMPVYDVETILIDIPARKNGTIAAQQEGNDRWDPKWNGRKNFKAFRRAVKGSNGETGPDVRRRNHNKVIVPMVDAKTSTYGVGDQYWDKSDEEKEREKRRKASQRTTQSQSDQSRESRPRHSQTIHGSDSEDDDASANGHGSHGNRVVDVDDVTDEDDSRPPNASNDPTQATTSHNAKGAKRQANSIGRGNTSKKQKTLPVMTVHDSDSDDSDDMKFKFGSRRRGKGKT